MISLDDSTARESTSAVSAALAAIVPLAHHEEFHTQTTEKQRKRIVGLLQIFDEIANGQGGVTASAHRIALERPSYGLSPSNMLRLYYLYKNTNDWRTLVPKWRSGSKGLPAEFVEFFRKRTEQNKRDTSARAVMGQIKDEWSQGESIPGFGTWREYHASTKPEKDVPARFPFGYYPRGWGQSNLYTKQSTKAQRKISRRGMAAAKKHLPHVIRDTSGLRFMELIVIDDFETDIHVQARNPATGRYEIVTCTGLYAMDVATRTKLALGLKPRFTATDDDGKDDKAKRKRRIAITRADVQFLLHSIFSVYHLPADWGCTILCENAAAAITDDVADMLEALFGVQVARTGMLAEKVLANGFVPNGGKPWEKGWIESTFNIVGNHAGAFAGQKGAMYQLKPDDFAARLLYAENLLATDGLAPEQIDQLKTGFWMFDDALTAYTRIFDFLERRTQHAMQGFDEVCDYALSGEAGLLTLAEAQQLPREKITALMPIPRRQSPLERKAKLTEGMRRAKLPEHALALLLLTPKRCKLENLKITFTHLSEGFTFTEAGSPVLALPEGSELLGYFDPARPDRLFCCLLNGKYVGPIRRRGAVDIRNCAAIAAERGEITKIITQHVLAPVRARHADEDNALARLKAENEAKLIEWGSVAPDPDDGTKRRRHAVSAQLTAGTAGAQPRHVAAAEGLAVGVAEAGLEHQAAALMQRQEKALQRAGNQSADLLDEPTVASTAPAHSARSESRDTHISAEDLLD
jgi:hypothetical protein